MPADLASGRFTRPAGTDARTIEDNCLEINSRLNDFPLVVEVIPGEADQWIDVSMVVGSNHEPLVAYCIRRLTLYTYSKGWTYSHPYELGANVYCETTHDDEAVEGAYNNQQAIRGRATPSFRFGSGFC